MDDLEALRNRVDLLETIVFGVCRAVRRNDPDLTKLHNDLAEARRTAHYHEQTVDRALIELRERTLFERT